MKNISVFWLCTYLDGSVIGIVKAWDEIAKKWNFYVGFGLGKDESRDVQYIMDLGAKYDDVSFLKNFLEVPHDAGHA